MTTVKLTQVRTVAGDKFRLTATCSEASANIGNALFLFLKADDTYVHVCTVGDRVTYPEGPNEETHYRAASMEVDFVNLDEAIAALALQQTKMSNLITDWDAYESTFEGTDTYTYTAP